MHKGCPDLERIDSLLQGHFASPEEQNAWEQHLTECAEYRNQFESNFGNILYVQELGL